MSGVSLKTKERCGMRVMMTRSTVILLLYSRLNNIALRFMKGESMTIILSLLFRDLLIYKVVSLVIEFFITKGPNLILGRP